VISVDTKKKALMALFVGIGYRAAL
jgi:hypothetical protein